MRKIIFLVLVLGMAAQALWADDFLAKKQVALGKPVADFKLKDTAGQMVQLSDFKGKIVMIHFWSSHCPFVKRYEQRLKDIAADYTSKGVVVLGIDSNVNETAADIKKTAADRQHNYPMLLDPDSKIADQFGAITTPHIFIINKEGQLAYEGAVDDQGWSESNKVKKQYARLALDALLAAQAVPYPETHTAGCTVKRR